ncbi:LysR family transcriptional regulator [Marinobacterium arenosum]|uniref:LysR family transcriptional regulator n=1 Tax=Marinobacterium arenosum TaxID=2862496 RepID=UPI001C9772FA|nr:LysR family transcriptional regulator [Marinobacterium arenosum]MBY4677943.1 LysR family transcriptional regulator [Marinobacterium arenosum]
MSLRHLRTLVEVEQQGSFVAAADCLGLTQSAVSQQIRALEELLGVTLFDRSGRSPVLNSDGREACARARQLLQQYDNLSDGLGPAAGQRGSLAIGAIYTVQEGALAPVLAQMRGQFPQLVFKVFRGMSADLGRRVEEGELDAVIMTGPPQHLASHCEWQPLDSEPFYLIVPADSPQLSAGELLGTLPYIRFDRRAWAGTMIDTELRAQGIQLNELIQLDSLQAALRMVEHGLGVTIMPLNRKFITDVSARFRLLPFGEPQLTRQIGFYQRREHNRRQLTEPLLQAMQAYYSSEVDEKLLN